VFGPGGKAVVNPLPGGVRVEGGLGGKRGAFPPPPPRARTRTHTHEKW